MPLADITSTLVFLLALIVAISILLRRSYRYFGRSLKRAAQPAWQPARSRDASGPHSANADAARSEVHLHETARELCARIDSKVLLLDAVIRRADERIRRLETLLERSELTRETGDPVEARGDSRDPSPVPRGTASGESPDESQARAIAELSAQGYSATTIAHRLKLDVSQVQHQLAVGHSRAD